MNKYFKILELDKVLDMLALEASNEQTKTMIRETVPCSDFDTVKSEVNKALNAFDLSIKFGSPPFINFKNINNHLTRAKAGSRLSLKDLLEIANSLKQINKDSSTGYLADSQNFNLSEKLIEQFEKQLVEKDKRIEEKDDIIKDLKNTIAELKAK